MQSPRIEVRAREQVPNQYENWELGMSSIHLDELPMLITALKPVAIQAAARLRIAQGLGPTLMYNDEQFVRSFSKNLSPEVERQVSSMINHTFSGPEAPGPIDIVISTIIFLILIRLEDFSGYSIGPWYDWLQNLCTGAMAVAGPLGTYQARRDLVNERTLLESVEMDVDPVLENFFYELHELSRDFAKTYWDWSRDKKRLVPRQNMGVSKTDDNEIDERIDEVRRKAVELERQLNLDATGRSREVGGHYRVKAVERLRVVDGLDYTEDTGEDEKITNISPDGKRVATIG